MCHNKESDNGKKKLENIQKMIEKLKIEREEEQKKKMHTPTVTSQRKEQNECK